MNAMSRLLEGTGGKIAVAAGVGLLVIGIVCWIFWPTVSGWWSDEPPTTNIGSALARTKSAAPKAAPSRSAPKQGVASSPRKPAEEDLRPAPAADGPRQGEGEPRHVYHIEPFAKPSTIRVHAASSLSEVDARATALRLSKSLVHEADRFTVWFLDEETFLDGWTGGPDLEADTAKHSLWKVDSSRTGDGAFQVDTVESLRDSVREPHP